MTRLPATTAGRAKPAHHEEDAQRLVIRRCDALAPRYPALGFLFHPANGGKRDKRTAALMAAQGWYVRLHSAPDARTLADQVCLDLWAYLSIPARAYAPLLTD